MLHKTNLPDDTPGEWNTLHHVAYPTVVSNLVMPIG